MVKKEVKFWRVWMWGIEIGLGSHGQRKQSSQFIKMGFDSKAEALGWASSQDRSDWGFWLPSEVGENCIVECTFDEYPESYKQALKMGGLQEECPSLYS